MFRKRTNVDFEPSQAHLTKLPGKGSIFTENIHLIYFSPKVVVVRGFSEMTQNLCQQLEIYIHMFRMLFFDEISVATAINALCTWAQTTLHNEF